MIKINMEQIQEEPPKKPKKEPKSPKWLSDIEQNNTDINFDEEDF